MLVLKRRINQQLVLDTKDGRIVIDVKRGETDSVFTVRLAAVKVWRGEIAPARR